MRGALRAVGAATAFLVTMFALGPRVRVDESWQEPDVGTDPDAYLARVESRVPDIRPGERKAIVWADPDARSRTPLVVVYLHGFSADRHELSPVPERVAERLGANLYLARLTGHGRDGAAMGDATVRAWFQDGAEAMAVAAALGDRVVLMGTSTGATLALWIAAQEAWRGRLAALALVSPNLQPKDHASRLLLWPWGGAIARAVVGPERCFRPASRDEERHWAVCYPTRALLPMMGLVEHVRTMDLTRVRTPTIVFYSPEDRVVDPEVTLEAFPRLGTDLKSLVPVEGDGDRGHHVLAGDIMSPGTTDRVVDDVAAFVQTATNAPGG